ncbi:luciferase-like monooxygenase [Curtobacterium flaccumfaciens]|uniref:Luciferase-like monooxygenase n=1 Tax=Curtobacterium flaccumfaciens TaxID=2035 RepID=A0A4R6DFC5_9MICO|nr:LLM class flavin-dependent oxidoreductase [Curtobacterium flaccumfaciens]TDN43160.1 luciferase-like monooxygenase [Curtobacterium flaccumfaciens]
MTGTIVAVPDAELAGAVARPRGIADLAARIVASGADVVALGTDRFDPDRGRGHRLDPTTAALALGRALPTHGLLVAAAPTREHPYNVARRVLSLDHVLEARVGLVVGAHDHGLPPSDHRHDPAEFVAVVRGLWRTWPLDSITGDRETGRFADTDRIRPLDHDGGPGGYRVRGPLTTPSSRQGEPVLAVWHDVVLPDGAAAPDLVLGGDARPLAPLPDASDVTEASRASSPTPWGTGRRTLRDLLGLPVPGVVTP